MNVEAQLEREVAPAVRESGPEGGTWIWPKLSDPRLPFAFILASYCALGVFVLGFNRTPLQVVLTIGACMGFEVLFQRLFKPGEKVVPLSAFITGCGLSIVLNYAHNPWLLLLPTFFAIGSKYVFTYEGRHVFNPALFGVCAAITLGAGMFDSSPAYQWSGSWAMGSLFGAIALLFFIGRVNRLWLVSSFLVFYALQTLLRAHLLRWHVPPETVFIGTFTSPALFVFAFYMITDPKTSPNTPGAQVARAALVVVLDLAFNAVSSLSALLFALFTAGLLRWAWLHAARAWRTRGRSVPAALTSAPLLYRLAVLALFAASGQQVYARWIHPRVDLADPGFSLTKLSPATTGITCRLGTVLTEVDPRVAHIAKWVLSVGDAVAVGDVDGDGLPDLFFTNPLKQPSDRCALYRNLGNFRFERVPIPALDAYCRDPKTHGLPAGALLVDYDNSGRLSILIMTAFGPSRLLKNTRGPDGRPRFVDVSEAAGLTRYNICVAATFFDFDRDGHLDLLLANSMSPYLRDYPQPTKFNIFKLPQPEYPGDRRMFHFMHNSWDNATNGGPKELYRGNADGTFTALDSAAMGLPETHWTLAVGTADLNHDGFTDLYCANDFGPDDLYLNEGGFHFRRVQGPGFGDIGHDTYKGMNVTIADFDNRGWPDIYVSDVHAPLQPEGSLFWRVEAPKPGESTPGFRDTASERGVLNESRFGWGAAAGDLNLDGWLDLVQANGMVDDTPDKRFPTPRSYWYTASYVMRSGPEVHSYADSWGDLRGYDIWGHQANRVYLSRGPAARPEFADVAPALGFDTLGNSRAIALADLDNSGALDVIVTHQFAPPEIYRNDRLQRAAAAGSPVHWIGLELHGDGHRINTEAVGTRVILRYTRDGRTIEQSREISMTSGFSAQGDRRLLFGLGSYAGPVEVEIHWYGGPVETRRFETTGGYHVLRPPEV
jgi:enediyne biosynthesis protein E4